VAVAALLAAAALPAPAGEPTDPPSFQHARVVDAWKKYADKLTFGAGQTLALLDDGCNLALPQWAKSDGKLPKGFASPTTASTATTTRSTRGGAITARQSAFRRR
jgi:hypothetical protein